jgi:calcineurin-like phosphoesterase family protein
VKDIEGAKRPIGGHEHDARIADLRRKIDVGVEQAKAGKLSDGRAFFEQLRQKIRSAS